MGYPAVARRQRSSSNCIVCVYVCVCPGQGERKLWVAGRRVPAEFLPPGTVSPSLLLATVMCRLPTPHFNKGSGALDLSGFAHAYWQKLRSLEDFRHLQPNSGLRSVVPKEAVKPLSAFCGPSPEKISDLPKITQEICVRGRNLLQIYPVPSQHSNQCIIHFSCMATYLPLQITVTYLKRIEASIHIR